MRLSVSVIGCYPPVPWSVVPPVVAPAAPVVVAAVPVLVGAVPVLVGAPVPDPAPPAVVPVAAPVPVVPVAAVPVDVPVPVPRAVAVVPVAVVPLTPVAPVVAVVEPVAVLPVPAPEDPTLVTVGLTVSPLASEPSGVIWAEPVTWSIDSNVDGLGAWIFASARLALTLLASRNPTDVGPGITMPISRRSRSIRWSSASAETLARSSSLRLCSAVPRSIERPTLAPA